MWYNLLILYVQAGYICTAAKLCEVSTLVVGGGIVEVFLKVVLVIFSLALIAVVLLQKGKSAGLAGAISGGAEHLFGKQKARGLDLFLERMTVGIAAGFFIMSLVVAYVLK